MYPILFHIGKVNFYSHGLMIALGAIVGGGLIFYLAKRENLYRRNLIDLLLYSLVAGVLGSRILYLILYYYQFDNLKEMWLFWQGGLVSFGGFLFGFLIAGLYLRKKGEGILQWFDIGIIGLFLGWAVGRVGCYFAGDIPGINPHLSVPLLEAGWSLILAFGLFYFYWRKDIFLFYKSGMIFYIGLMGYFLGRFVIDFWRQEPILLFHLRGGQIASLSMFIILAVIFYWLYIKDFLKGDKDVKKNFQ